MVEDADELASQLQGKWYGTTNQPQHGGRSRGGGGIRRLVENCQNLAARLTEYNVIQNGNQNSNVLPHAVLITVVVRV
jgi:hypothetical protein